MSSEVKKSGVPVPEGVVELWIGGRDPQSLQGLRKGQTFGRRHIIPQFERKAVPFSIAANWHS